MEKPFRRIALLVSTTVIAFCIFSFLFSSKKYYFYSLQGSAKPAEITEEQSVYLNNDENMKEMLGSDALYGLSEGRKPNYFAGLFFASIYCSLGVLILTRKPD
jgi:hypothetical protein